MKNRYAKRSRISEARILEVVRYFAADRPSGGGLNRNTVNRPRLKGARMPARSGARCSALWRKASAHRVRGRRGRGAYGKTVVFGIFERQGQVYTEPGLANAAKPRSGGSKHGL